MDSSNFTIVELLDFWTCYFLNPQEGQLIISDVIDSANHTYRCRAYGRYLAGNDPDIIINGHFLCIAICALIFIVGVFGIISNVLNLVLLPVALDKSTLRNLLIILAAVELVACVFTMMHAFLTVIILEDLDRSKGSLEWFRISNIVFQLSRTASIFLSFLVTIERYLVIAYPMQSKMCLKSTNIYVYLPVIVLLSVVLNLPRLTQNSVEENDIFTANTTVEEYPFMWKPTKFAEVLNPDIQEVLTILNYIVPVPILVFSNGLLYTAIYKWNKTRVRVSGRHKRELSAAKMFSFAVLMLLLCNMASFVIFYTSRVNKVIFRELMLLQSFSIVVGASVNFVVYCRFSLYFRNEFKKLLKRSHKVCRC